MTRQIGTTWPTSLKVSKPKVAGVGRCRVLVGYDLDMTSGAVYDGARAKSPFLGPRVPKQSSLRPNSASLVDPNRGICSGPCLGYPHPVLPSPFQLALAGLRPSKAG